MSTSHARLRPRPRSPSRPAVPGQSSGSARAGAVPVSAPQSGLFRRVVGRRQTQLGEGCPADGRYLSQVLTGSRPDRARRGTSYGGLVATEAAGRQRGRRRGPRVRRRVRSRHGEIGVPASTTFTGSTARRRAGRLRPWPTGVQTSPFKQELFSTSQVRRRRPEGTGSADGGHPRPGDPPPASRRSGGTPTTRRRGRHVPSLVFVFGDQDSEHPRSRSTGSWPKAGRGPGALEEIARRVTRQSWCRNPTPVAPRSSEQRSPATVLDPVAGPP